jgi:hypothetical protein
LVVDAVNDTLKAIAASLSIFCLLVVTPIVTLYLLNDWDGLNATIDRSVPMAQRETVRTLSREIDDTLAGFLRGAYKHGNQILRAGKDEDVGVFIIEILRQALVGSTRDFRKGKAPAQSEGSIAGTGIIG